jgi:uncharacterized membrane protein YbhN (UPF0104 family)
MQRLWQEVRAGWNDARWGFDVLVALLPLTVVVVLLVDVLIGRIQIPPRVWMFGYGILAGLFIRVLAVRLWHSWKRRLLADWKKLQALTRPDRGGRQITSGVRGGEVRGDSPTRHRSNR